MSETERSLRETLDSILAISKKESSMLSAIEALGKVINDLKSELRGKDYRIAELEKELAERRASGEKD